MMREGGCKLQWRVGREASTGLDTDGEVFYNCLFPSFPSRVHTHTTCVLVCPYA